MASDRAADAAVAAMFVSACVTYSDAEKRVYRRVLVDVSDAEVRAAVEHIVLTQRWEYGLKPSPALLMDAVRHVRARSAARARPIAEPLAPADQQLARLAEARAQLIPRSKS